MKTKKIVFLLLVIILPFMSACDNYAPICNCDCDSIEPDPKYVKDAYLDFDLEDETIHISEYTYGNFIEHISKCIYTSIWSELLMDRKFYHPIDEKNSQWEKIGNKDVISNAETDFSGNNYTPIINAGSGIAQKSPIVFVKYNSYNHYVYAKGTGLLEYSIKNSDGEKIYSTFLDISSPTEFKKINFTVSCMWDCSEDEPNFIQFESISGRLELASPSIMPSDNIYGMRADTLKKLKELNAPFYRWPGGNFVSGYNWKDGIGDRDHRISWRNYEYAGIPYGDPHCGDWNTTDALNHPLFESEEEMIVYDSNLILKRGFYSVYDSNDFGLDEFIVFCKYLNAEPNIVVNAGYDGKTKDFNVPQDAADEVAYCNTIGTEYGNLRPSKDPYDVRYWSIGNEMNGQWQLGHVDLEEYKTRHTAFYKAMKNMDPSIKIIAVGDNAGEWGRGMTSLYNEMDYISEHFYAPRDDMNVKNHILNMKKMAEYRIKNHRNSNNLAFSSKVKISFDEYAFQNASQTSMLMDGMAVAATLNTFIYNNDVVGIACYSSALNVVQGSITTDSYGAYMQGNGFILSLYRNYFEEFALPITSSYVVPDKENYFEVAAAISFDKKTITISVINTSNFYINLLNNKLNGKTAKYCTVYSEFLSGYNSLNNQDILMKEGVSDKPRARPKSVTIFTFNLE